MFRLGYFAKAVNLTKFAIEIAANFIIISISINKLKKF